ncbi:YciC family protein [Candidatus Blochmannia vicinus (nom. nud.)]|uniref:YciC family protein n=1 Tax=Candidatus Blochmannia vicinus (nom. nud.) TaxID=251540 RepID=UPI0020248E86|nr:YciC family protein [Candidatus Blochmannia vicinus]URJ30391.1 envelope biogenesis factor ElyC [Candidatus Blochmannia vicinus]
MLIKLSRDVLNFIHNYCTKITILILITTLIQACLDYIFLPKQEELIFMNNFVGIGLHNVIKELSVDQQCILFRLSAANSISKILSSTFLFGNILTMLHLISTTNESNQHLNIGNIIASAMLIFPKFLLLIFCTTLFVQLGLIIAIIPGIALAIIISLTPVIVITDNLPIMDAIYLSIKISYRNFHLITPPILLWFLIKTILMSMLFHHHYYWIFITKIFVNSFNNALSVIILIYLYRLYMIIKAI